MLMLSPRPGIFNSEPSSAQAKQKARLGWLHPPGHKGSGVLGGREPHPARRSFPVRRRQSRASAPANEELRWAAV